MITTVQQTHEAIELHLAATDYTQLPDVNLLNKSDFTFYRESLRKLYALNTVITIIPKAPEPIWATPQE